jgi:methylglutaconyl-CoA hydratase
VRAVGPRQARRWFQTAEVMDAETAQAIGLLHEVVAEDQLDARVAAFVDSLLAAGPQALAASKRLVAITSEANESSADTLKRQTAELIARLRVSEEGQEGLAAFLKKRKPDWMKSG